MPSLTFSLKRLTVIHGGASIAGTALERESDSLALFIDRSIRSRSPFVYIGTCNHPKTLVALHAVWRTGRICIPVDPHLKPAELDERMTDTPPAAMIAINDSRATFDYDDEVRFFDMPPTPAEDALTDAALLYYCAGYDGYQKAAILTHANLSANAHAIVSALSLDSGMTTCAFIPFSHLYGIQSGLLTPCLTGGTILIESISSTAAFRALPGLLQMRHVDYLCSVPAIYYLLAKFPAIRESIAKTHCICGGYLLHESIAQTFLQKTGKNILNGYGLSEASPACTLSRPGEAQSTGSVGRPLDCCEVAIFDERGSRLAPGVIGEIWIRGTNVMQGYYRAAAATAATVRHGWLKTEDRGWIDGQGCLYLSEPKSSLFKVGGKSVFPHELERQLATHKDVERAVVTAQSDPLNSHLLTATITLKNGASLNRQAFISWCRDNISSYKVPSHFIFE